MKLIFEKRYAASPPPVVPTVSTERDAVCLSYAASSSRDTAKTGDWNKFRPLGLILATLLSFLGQTIAQPLDELLQLVTENNIELKVLYQEYQAALQKAPQVSQMPDPQINAGLFILQPETRVGPQWVKVGASQMFPWKGTLKAREDVVLAMAKVKFERIAATQLELYYEIKKAYYQLYELEKSQEVVSRNVKIFNSLERFTLSKVENGKGSLADVLRVRLKIQELEQELKLLENRKSKATATINHVLDRPPDTSVRIMDSLSTATLLFNKDTLADNIDLYHPMIRMFSHQQMVSKKAMDQNRYEGKPTFGVGLDYILVTKRKDIEVSKNGRDILMPKASVNIPLNRKKNKAKQKEEELLIAALENKKEDLKNKFLSVIEKAYADHEEAILKLDLYKDMTRTTQAVIDVLEADYSASGRNFDELLRLQTDLVNYDLKALKAVVQSHLAKAAIERFIF